MKAVCFSKSSGRRLRVLSFGAGVLALVTLAAPIGAWAAEAAGGGSSPTSILPLPSAIPAEEGKSADTDVPSITPPGVQDPMDSLKSDDDPLAWPAPGDKNKKPAAAPAPSAAPVLPVVPQEISPDAAAVVPPLPEKGDLPSPFSAPTAAPAPSVQPVQMPDAKEAAKDQPVDAALEERVSRLEEKLRALEEGCALKTDVDSLKKNMETLRQSPEAKPQDKEAAKPSAADKPKSVSKKKAVARSSRPVKWVFKSAKPGIAWVKEPGSQDLRTVVVGQKLPGLGKILSIAQDSAGKWIIAGTEGKLGQ